MIHSACRKNQKELTFRRALWANDELLRPHTFQVKSERKQIYTVLISYVCEKLIGQLTRAWNRGSAGGVMRFVRRTPPSFWGVWHSLSGARKPLMGKKEWNYWLLPFREIIVAGHCQMNLGFYGIFYSGLERWRHLFLRLSSVIKHLLSINGTQAYEFIHGKVQNGHEFLCSASQP